MKVAENEILGFYDIMGEIIQYNLDIKIFQGLIYELKKLRRPCDVHLKELNKLRREKFEIELTLLN